MKNIDWANLPFGYVKTNANVRCHFKNGKWSELEVSDSEHINLHMAATCLHYGQESFEGLKAYRGKDGQVRLFRWKDNAERMIRSARGIMMAEVPVELFGKAIKKAVQLNEEFIPPYGSGATLYLRPLLIGTEARVGVKPADEYLFLVFATPVGPYFKTGFNALDLLIERSADRAAPLGTGTIKVGGNYAASLFSLDRGHKLGFSSTLFLDPAEKKYIDECGPANFFAIQGNVYITPQSTSILPSITNLSLMDLARDMGMKVEQRKVLVEELATFDEVGTCGTAAIITPVKRIADQEMDKVYTFCKDGKTGPISTKLYNRLKAVQCGDEPDKWGWVEIVEV
jgi:branched-chain amino acid aminotransferase